MSQGRAYSSVASVPFLLAPRSPGRTIDSQVFVQKLEARFSKLDHARRTTGSWAHDDLEAGCALPPLISASFRGAWVASPWSKRPREPTDGPRDVDGLLAELGIPRDLAEVDERRKRLRLIQEDGPGPGHGGGGQRTATATTPATRQTSVTALGSSSKPGLVRTTEKPPRSASSSGAAGGTLGPGLSLRPITKSSPATPVGSPRAEREDGGRSLGEDEEILFEQGCTQMELPPTQVASASPIALAAHSSGIVPASKDCTTSTPFAARKAIPGPSPRPPPSTPPKLAKAAAALSATTSLPGNISSFLASPGRLFSRTLSYAAGSSASQISASAPNPNGDKAQPAPSQEPRLLTSFPSSSQFPNDDLDGIEDELSGEGLRGSETGRYDAEISAFLEDDVRA